MKHKIKPDRVEAQGSVRKINNMTERGQKQ